MNTPTIKTTAYLTAAGVAGTLLHARTELHPLEIKHVPAPYSLMLSAGTSNVSVTSSSVMVSIYTPDATPIPRAGQFVIAQHRG